MELTDNEKRIKQAEAKRIREQILADEDFKAVASTVAGRRFIRRVISECGVYQSSFNSDSAVSAFKEGRRSIGLWMLTLFDEIPDTYLQLLTEKTSHD